MSTSLSNLSQTPCSDSSPPLQKLTPSSAVRLFSVRTLLKICVGMEVGSLITLDDVAHLFFAFLHFEERLLLLFPRSGRMHRRIDTTATHYRATTAG
jgi:hypothetical protein